MVSFPALVEDPTRLADPAWVDALKDLVRRRMVATLEIAKIDGDPAMSSPVGEVMLEHGFVRGYKGLTWVPPRAERGAGSSRR